MWRAGAGIVAVGRVSVWGVISHASLPLVQVLLPRIGTLIWLKCTMILVVAGIIFGLAGSWASLSRATGRAIQI